MPPALPLHFPAIAWPLMLALGLGVCGCQSSPSTNEGRNVATGSSVSTSSPTISDKQRQRLLAEQEYRKLMQGNTAHPVDTTETSVRSNRQEAAVAKATPSPTPPAPPTPAVSVTRATPAADFIGSLPAVKDQKERIPLTRSEGVYSVPVHLNGVMWAQFTVDSGAADVMLRMDVAQALLNSGTLRREDFLSGANYRYADGSRTHNQRFLLRTLQIGNRVLRDVACAVSTQHASMLLGQSALEKLGKFSFDYTRQELVLE